MIIYCYGENNKVIIKLQVDDLKEVYLEDLASGDIISRVQQDLFDLGLKSESGSLHKVLISI